MSEYTTGERIRIDSPVTPQAGARPTHRLPGLAALLCSCLAVLGSVLPAPLLPSIEQAFAETPGIEALTLALLTLPALVIGLTAAPIGRVTERVGPRRLLLWALPFYAVVGTAPVWLTTLPSLLVSRALLGVAEAAIMVCGTTLLARHFHGRQRNRYFGLQTVFTTIAATIFFPVSGLLGEQDWRTPFWLYALSLPLTLLVLLVVRRESGDRAPQAHRIRLPWATMAAPVVISLAGGTVFYVLIVELPSALGAVGVVSSATIGLISATSSVATAGSALLFGWIGRYGPIVAVPVAFALSGVGIVVLAFAGTLPLVIAGAVVTGAGNGLLLPALLSWMLGSLRDEHQTRGIGIWTAAMFGGQFICPLLLQSLPEQIIGFSPALLTVGGLALFVGLMAVAVAPEPGDSAAR